VPTHRVLGRAAGLNEDQLTHIGDEEPPAGVYPDDLDLVRRYARTSTAMEQISDELYAELRATFSQDQIIELCMEVGLANLVNRFHRTFLTPLD
jgi:alkylhydroperoxidase family enzyme